MIMELPEKFCTPYAKVKNGKLYIYRTMPYESLIYNLTYACKKKRCIYCNKKIKRGKACTLDHRYPRDTGGVSITNNLFPCCPRCNSKKNNLTHEEFLKWRELSKKEAKEYMAEIKEERENIFETTGFILPEEWVEYEERDKIICEDNGQYVRGKRYNKVKEFYEKYHHFPRPAIVDRAGRLLDGYNTILFARDFDINYIPIIRLENVVKVLEEEEE